MKKSSFLRRLIYAVAEIVTYLSINVFNSLDVKGIEKLNNCLSRTYFLLVTTKRILQTSLVLYIFFVR